MTVDSAEYQALERVVTADRRYRRFLYALAVAMFVLILSGMFALGYSISNKIDGLVEGSVARGNARQQETKTMIKESERYNTCIFVLPIDQRTPANQQKCFEAADLPGGLDRGDFTPISLPVFSATDSAASTSATPAPSSSSSSASSSQPTPRSTSAQPNNVQPSPSMLSRILRLISL